MSVRQHALAPHHRRSLQRLCVTAAIVVAGVAAVSIQTVAGASEADEAAEASGPEVRRVTVTPVDRVELEVDPEPIDALATALVARYELLATAPPEPEPTPEPEPEPVAAAEPDEPVGTDEPAATDEPDEPAASEDDGDAAAGDDGTDATADEAPAGSADDGAVATSNVPLETWEAVARCESGYGGEPDWSINTGNGYYGGLQFNIDSWRWVGGTGYPHEASKATQIEMAERLWERQGWNAWPACSSQLGLR